MLSRSDVRVLLNEQATALASKLPQVLARQQRLPSAMLCSDFMHPDIVRARQLGDCPVVMMSALKGSRVAELMDAVLAAHDVWRARVSTADLLRFVPNLAHSAGRASVRC